MAHEDERMIYDHIERLSNLEVRQTKTDSAIESISTDLKTLTELVRIMKEKVANFRWWIFLLIALGLFNQAGSAVDTIIQMVRIMPKIG